ncbi:MAG: caspase family protein, partial [Pseudomonadota bacterium]
MRGIALVIGNGEYEHLESLPNPGNDARDMEKLLDQLGFETEFAINRNAKRLKRDIRNFLEDAEEADVALVYYAGHGIEAGGENFIVPVDANPDELRENIKNLLPLSSFLSQLRETVPVAIVLMDACRINPFPPDFKLRLTADSKPVSVAATGLGIAGLSEGSRGSFSLAEQDQPNANNIATIISFAAAPGRAALDGEAGGNSPYASALLKHLVTPNATFSDVMTMVTEEVYLKTGSRQRPWTNASLRRLLYFGSTVKEDNVDDSRLTDARRELLLTISTTPTHTRSLVDSLAQQNDVSLDLLYGMLKELNIDVSEDTSNLEQKLREGAKNLKSLTANTERAIRNDKELTRLASLADRAQSEGVLSLAREYRALASKRADELDDLLNQREDALKADRLELASTYADEADTALLSFDYETATKQYEAAF